MAIKDPMSRTVPYRTWYSDHFYAQLNYQSNQPFEHNGREYPEVDRTNKHPYSLQLLSSNFRDAYSRMGIYCPHTLHLPRSLGAMTCNLEG